MDVTVIVPARDAGQLLDGLLAALARQDFAGEHEVLVVDNGSTDDTAARAERSGVVARVLRRVRGDGPGAARNEGAAAALGRVLAFTDADCRPAPDWLTAGWRAVASADLVQGAVRPEPGVPIGPYDRSLGVTQDLGLYQTANLLVRADWFERLGGFRDWRHDSIAADSRPFGEDVEFVWRARRAGAEVRFAPGALVHHAVLRGDVSAWMRERARSGHFAELAVRVPELRDRFFYRRWFLSRRTAAFDLAAAGAVGALLLRRPALAVGTAVPYGRLLLEDARRWGAASAPTIAAVRVVGDAVAAASLLRGSLKARRPLF